VASSKGIGTRFDRAATSGVLWLLAAFTLLPLLLIVVGSVTPSGDLVTGFSVPSRVTGENFRHAWTSGQFGTHLRVSAIVTTSIVAVSAIGSIMAGFALGALRTPVRGSLALLFIVGIVVPYEALIIPLYYQMRSFGLTDTYWALILPQSALSLAFGVYWMRGFFRSIPRSFLETAWIEGASSWRLLWEILVPLARPAIATMVILSFMWNWNEFLLPVVMISDSDHATAPLALATFQGRFDVNIAELTAAAIIVAVPIIVLYIVLQRRFLAAFVQGTRVD
jgi:raffinose/stachyose/melibiose transport system permease protein